MFRSIYALELLKESALVSYFQKQKLHLVIIGCLDIGCNTGNLTTIIARKVDTNH